MLLNAFTKSIHHVLLAFPNGRQYGDCIVDNRGITFIVEKLLLLVDKPFVVHLEPEWKGLFDCLHELTDSSFILQPLKVAQEERW
jgi:hypothetical protein